jgi:hypothetical protein
MPICASELTLLTNIVGKMSSMGRHPYPEVHEAEIYMQGVNDQTLPRVTLRELGNELSGSICDQNSCCCDFFIGG